MSSSLTIRQSSKSFEAVIFQQLSGSDEQSVHKIHRAIEMIKIVYALLFIAYVSAQNGKAA